MTDDPVAALVSRLESNGFDPRPTGPNTWESRCPAHSGRRHNLSITTGDDGRALIHCHHVPGCTPEAIAAALGLGIAGLFPAARNGEPSVQKSKVQKLKTTRLIAPTKQDLIAKLVKKKPWYGRADFTSWPYKDASGRLVFWVVRIDPVPEASNAIEKTYRPMHETPEGWVFGDPDGPLPLYRLPTLADAQTVFVVEGEKCVEALREIGLTARRRRWP